MQTNLQINRIAVVFFHNLKFMTLRIQHLQPSLRVGNSNTLARNPYRFFLEFLVMNLKQQLVVFYCQIHYNGGYLMVAYPIFKGIFYKRNKNKRCHFTLAVIACDIYPKLHLVAKTKLLKLYILLNIFYLLLKGYKLVLRIAKHIAHHI